MKRIITFLFAIGFVLYMGSISAHAQGKGPGPGSNRGPAAPAVEHGKSADHSQGHDAKDVKETRQDTKLEQRFENDPEFRARMMKLLPMGMDLKTAMSGFKNQGQCIAALHVANNLNISFTELKAKMTGNNPESLGKAIHDLKTTIPVEEANKEAEKAEKQAKADEKPTTKPTS
jgi:hypothetical protein